MKFIEKWANKGTLMWFLVGWFIASFIFLVFNIMGYHVLRSVGNSMRPSIGDCVYVAKNVDNPRDDIKVGDVVVYYRGLFGTLHRVIGKCYGYCDEYIIKEKDCILKGEIMNYTESGNVYCHVCQQIGWETKGDNNVYSDGCIPFDYFTEKFIVKLWCG